MRKKKFPYDETPDIHNFRGVPESCFDVVNQYGTYNIQPTTNTENLFPLIGPGLPRDWENMSVDKYDVEEEE